MENISREYSREKVREMIEAEAMVGKFIYLGANIDAEVAAEEVGFPLSVPQDFLARQRKESILTSR